MTSIEEKDIHEPRVKANLHFREKREARIARMEDLAEKNKERAEHRFDTASEMASFIPLG